MADVERDHPGRAALEEDVCEAAGRSSDVERIATRYFHAERIESVRELLAPPGDIRRRLVDGQLDRLVDLLARFGMAGHPARHHQGLRLGATFREPAFDQQHVQPVFSPSSSLARASAHA